LITAKEIICGEADALGLKFSEIGLGIETDLGISIGNVEMAYLTSLASMFQESETQFGAIKLAGIATADNINQSFIDKFTEILTNLNQLKTDMETPWREFKTKGKNIASDIGKSFSDKFAAILADLNKLKTNLEPALREIQGLFATTALSMQIVFAAATANININLVNMENQGQQSSSLLSRCYEGFWDVLSKINTMYNAVNNSLKVLNVLEIVSTGVVKTKAAALVATAAAYVKKGAAAAFAAASAAAHAVASTFGAAAIPIAIGMAAVGAAFIGLKFAGVFAEGGFPDRGSLFVAGEAGPELIGTFPGNRTAVANNVQILQGISAGVYEANRETNLLLGDQNQILFEQNRQLQENNRMTKALLDKETDFKVDGRSLLDVTDRARKERGLNLMNGGVAYGF